MGRKTRRYTSGPASGYASSNLKSRERLTKKFILNNYSNELIEDMNSLLPWEKRQYLNEEEEKLREDIADSSPLSDKELNNLVLKARLAGISENYIKAIKKRAKENPAAVRKIGYSPMLEAVKALKKEVQNEIEKNEQQLEKAKKQVTGKEVEDKSIFHRFHPSVSRGIRKEKKIRKERSKKLKQGIGSKQLLSPEQAEKLIKEKQVLETQLKELEKQIASKNYTEKAKQAETDLNLMRSIVEKNKRTSGKIKELHKIFNSHFPLKGTKRFLRNKEEVEKALKEYEGKAKELSSKRRELIEKIKRIEEQLKN